MKIECKVSCRLPSEYSDHQAKGNIRLLFYSILNENHGSRLGGGASPLTDTSNKPIAANLKEKLGDNLENHGRETARHQLLNSLLEQTLKNQTTAPSNDFHLVMVFGDEFSSKSLEMVRNGDTRQSLDMRGASLWKKNEKYKKLWDQEGEYVWNDAFDESTLDQVYHATEQLDEKKLIAEKIDTGHSLNLDASNPLVRIHSSCFTGETMGSLRCDCAEQLHSAIYQMSAVNSGLLIYLHQEGRGIGLLSKLFAYNLIDTRKYDTYSANVALGHLPDERDYKVASLILDDLGVDQCKLLTNNPDKIEQLRKDGINITSRLEMVPLSWSSSASSSQHDPDKELDLHSDHTSTVSTTPTAAHGFSVSEKQSTINSALLLRQTQLAQDRDGYLLTKIKKMGHKLSVPAFIETLLAESNAAVEHFNE